MTPDVFAKRAGRVAFGLVLIAGVPVLVQRALAFRDSHRHLTSWHAAEVIGVTWALAFAIALVVTAVASYLPPRRDPDALRHASLAVPAVGIAFLLPLTLHMLVYANTHDGFDDWTSMSVMLVSHTHIAFAVLVYARADSLTHERKPVSIKLVYIVTCLMAAIPFVLPVLWVAVTGIPIIPLLAWMERVARLDRERSHAVPFAIARAA